MYICVCECMYDVPYPRLACYSPFFERSLNPSFNPTDDDCNNGCDDHGDYDEEECCKFWEHESVPCRL